MEHIKKQQTNGNGRKELAYRVNGALILLFCLLFLCGTLCEMLDISMSGILSEGNVLVYLSILFVGAIYTSWYNEKASGILLLIFGLSSFAYFVFNSGFSGRFILPVIILMMFVLVGTYFIYDSLKNKRNIQA